MATYPPGAPPGRFLKLALAGEEATFIPAASDDARLALVNSSEADSALLSSATPPARVPVLEARFCLAERVPVPSTGIAVRNGRGGAAKRLVDAHRRALALIASDEALAQHTAQAFGFDASEAAWMVAVARQYFSADGRVPPEYVLAGATGGGR